MILPSKFVYRDVCLSKLSRLNVSASVREIARSPQYDLIVAILLHGVFVGFFLTNIVGSHEYCCSR